MDNSLAYFLKNFLRDSLSLNFNYFRPPFSNIHPMDQYLRQGLQNSEKLYDSLQKYLDAAEYGYFYILCDKYWLNYVYIRPYPDKPDIISVGPYLKRPVDQDFFTEIADRNHMAYSSIEAIRGLMYQFPIFDNTLKLLSLLNDILHYILPGGDAFQIKEINLSETTDAEENYQPVDNYQAYAETVAERYSVQDKLMDSVANGDITNALMYSARFKTMMPEQGLDDLLTDRKSLLYALNTTLRISAARSDVHPVFLHEISRKYVKLFEGCTSLSELDKLHEKMVREYCLLVKNKSRIHNTPLIKNVLNYIEFNLNQPLTLSEIAAHFSVSSPYLSKMFKQEVHENLTDYVTTQKLHVALRLLTTTNMQIQEIAAYIGIYDCNYFSKTFRKRIGSTPSEYRKKYSYRHG
ncbi:MAG: helix-turn-helix transcriptional regulator [Clostridiales bacterium]|nr:helix-turn-helix transcriptional regulator [Clostridiales bacterium]